MYTTQLISISGKYLNFPALNKKCVIKSVITIHYISVITVNYSFKFSILPATIKVNHDIRLSIKRICKLAEYMLC